MTLNVSKYVQKHYFTLKWCKTCCCICTNIIIARIKNVYKKRKLIKKILILIWGFLLSILCNVTCVSDKLSCSTCTERCKSWNSQMWSLVWVQWLFPNRAEQTWTSPLPETLWLCCSKPCSSLDLRLTNKQRGVTSKKRVEHWNCRAKIICEVFFSASYQQLRGNETRHRLAGRRRAASCPSPCDCPRSHPFHISPLQNIWQTTQTQSSINMSILAHTSTRSPHSSPLHCWSKIPADDSGSMSTHWINQRQL